VLPLAGGAAAAAGVAFMLLGWRRRGAQARPKPGTPRPSHGEDLLLEAELDRLR
jgi:hypothetical protein